MLVPPRKPIYINRYLGVCINTYIKIYTYILITIWGFPGGSEVKVSACSAGDPGSIPGSGRAPGEGEGNPLQYSCLENPTDREAWRATVHGVKEPDMT